MDSDPLKTGQIIAQDGTTISGSLVYSRIKHLCIRAGVVLLPLGLVVTGLPPLAVGQPPPITVGQRSTALLLQQGQREFQAGHFAAAITSWDQAQQQAQQQGDLRTQATALSRLAAAHQELGQWESAQTAIAHSLTLLNPAHLKSSNAKHRTDAPDRISANTELIYAQALNTQGNLQLAMGQADTALATWQQAEHYYNQAQDSAGQVGAQLNQAQALQTLGLFRRAQSLLQQVNAQLQTQPDPELKVLGLENLGSALQATGNLRQSQTVLEDSLDLAQTLDQPHRVSAILLGLGNTLRALEQPGPALQAYQQSAEQAPTPISRLDAQINQLSLLVDTQDLNQAQALWQQIQPSLQQLPPSRKAIYAQVNAAASAITLLGTAPEQRPPVAAHVNRPRAEDIAQLLQAAAAQAQQLQDARSQSYALGQLGHLYEQTQQWQQAQEHSQTALVLAQQANAMDIAYLWHWQLGRIFNRQFEQAELQAATVAVSRSPLREQAIAAYTDAVNTLQPIRADLLATHREVQFSFKKSVEPLYRQLVSLLVEPNASATDLETARTVIEGLQLAELENYFRSACLDSVPQQIDQIDTNAAVLYPIVLSDRLEVILSLPNQPLTHYTTPLPQAEVDAALSQFLSSLNRFFPTPLRLKKAQQLYDWLIRPAEAAIANSGTQTLVFVLDGKLSNLPMAALYDGQQYLVEKYSIALAPGLHLLEPKSLFPQRIDTLIAGLSEARQGFSALPGVETEVTEISSRLQSEVVLNQQFTLTELEQRLEDSNAPVVHLATHGQFSSLPEDTFLLSWDQKIGVNPFRGLLQERELKPSQPIELLVLSACQTADGDERAALGLAGLAVKSGARSTLATLWSVKDESTALLMAQFYQTLSQPVERSKAESLRQAQIALLRHPEFNHPFYWAPFVLVGNWL